MTRTLTHDGATYRVVKALRPFAIGVPHQRPAYVAYPDDAPPSEADGDRFIGGDHDLHAVYLVETLADVLPLLQWKDERGGQSRHQAIRIAALTIGELFDQGVLTEDMEDPTDG